MTFIRGTINTGLREAMKQEVIKTEFYHPSPDNHFTDIELLRYVSTAGCVMVGKQEFLQPGQLLKK